MKLVVMVFQPLSKFGMFASFVSYTIYFIVFFLNWWRKQDFWIFRERTKTWKFSKEEGTKEGWIKFLNFFIFVEF